ncbi:hypothetical protein EXIGLDRAFT_700424 [Exidia glandulosa HHB12029]|uniref:Uncharacterized protein n=1 Tax=Exidia glandulosa HHB12029 TaxID=1314781 RepID=A0A165DG88_EXIGL|nr:hypothetical protein EXIGLDRAFT_700424 [Exidia glandulosa HHB12029]
MAEYKLTVYITGQWVQRMKDMEVNLCVAKKVNDSYTVVFNSKDRDYDFQNEFKWSDQYKVGAIAKFDAGESLLTVAASRKVPIAFGQTVVRNENGTLENAAGPIDTKKSSFAVDNRGGMTSVVVDQLIGTTHKTIWADPKGMPAANIELTPQPKVMVFFHKIMKSGVMFAEVKGRTIEVDFSDSKEGTVSYVDIPSIPGGGGWVAGKADVADHLAAPVMMSYSVKEGFQPLDSGDANGEDAKE